MNILVTGAKGMMGTALVNRLKTIQDGRDKTRPNIQIGEIYEYDRGDEDKLDEFCSKTSFVFNLAGINRPKDPAEFREGNFGFASQLLDTLKKYNNKANVTIKAIDKNSFFIFLLPLSVTLTFLQIIKKTKIEKRLIYTNNLG